MMPGMSGFEVCEKLKQHPGTRLTQVVPVLGALLRRYWSGYGPSKLEASPPDHSVEQIFARFGEEKAS